MKHNSEDTCTPMSIAALFTIARTWKQPKCPLTDEWIKKMWFIYTMGYSVQFSSVTQSCPTLCDPMDCSPWTSPGQNTGVGSPCLLQGIFPTQGWNPGLPHCRRILYQLSRKGSPRILEWVVYPFSSGSSGPRNWTGVSCFVGVFFTNWATKEVLSV